MHTTRTDRTGRVDALRSRPGRNREAATTPVRGAAAASSGASALGAGWSGLRLPIQGLSGSIPDASIALFDCLVNLLSGATESRPRKARICLSP